VGTRDDLLHAIMVSYKFTGMAEGPHLIYLARVDQAALDSKGRAGSIKVLAYAASPKKFIKGQALKKNAKVFVINSNKKDILNADIYYKGRE
jgi:hypothetical protein